MGKNVRKAVIADLDELAKLFNDYRVFYEKRSDLEAAKKFLHERIIKSEAEIFVAFSGRAMAGFTLLYPLFSSTRMKRLWLLNDLFIKEKYRGLGFSIALMERAKALCWESGACGFMLETAKTNTTANRLYQKFGLALDTEHNIYHWEADEKVEAKPDGNSTNLHAL